MRAALIAMCAVMILVGFLSAVVAVLGRAPSRGAQDAINERLHLRRELGITRVRSY